MSAFHHRGAIADARWIELRWPRAARVPGPAVEDGRAVEPDRDMGFRLDIDSGRPLDLKSGLRDGAMLAGITAVDQYPLHSYLGFYGGARDRVLLRQPDGTTYDTSEGYEFTGRDLPGG